MNILSILLVSLCVTAYCPRQKIELPSNEDVKIIVEDEEGNLVAGVKEAVEEQQPAEEEAKEPVEENNPEEVTE